MRIKIKLFLAIFFLLINSFQVGAQEGTTKKAIAIVNFENLTDYQEGNIEQRITSLLETELVKLKRFNVIEREQLEMILKEQGLTLSGFLASVGSEKSGQIKGVDALLTGKITEYHTVPENRHSSWKDKKGVIHHSYSTTLKTRIEIAIKMVDVATGEILLAESNDGFEKRLLSSRTGYPSMQTIEAETNALTSKATSECLTKIVKSIEKIYPLEGVILNVEGKEVYIDIGLSHGLTKNKKLRVERVTKTLTHPVTGKVIGKIRDKVGEIQVKELYDNYSKARITKVEKGQEIKAGDLCISKQ